MNASKSAKKGKRFPRRFVVKMSDQMVVALRRLYGRRAGAKIRELLVRNIPLMSDKSSVRTPAIKATTPFFEAARMLAGCYASLRELQRQVGSCPPDGLTLVHGDLSTALNLIERKLGEVRALLAAVREERP